MTALRVKKLNEQAILPSRATVGSIGYDLYALERVSLAPNAVTLVNTGIAIELPPGHYGRVAPRSGLAFKFNIDVFAGVIDPDYRGEVTVLLFNHSASVVTISSGDRVAQLILEKASVLPVEEIEELQSSDRGADGWGSTGK